MLKILGLLAFGMMLTNSANATTYEINLTSGSNSVAGYIVTNSSIGPLNELNIIDWNLTETVGFVSTNLSLGTSSLHLAGDNLTATDFGLFYDTKTNGDPDFYFIRSDDTGNNVIQFGPVHDVALRIFGNNVGTIDISISEPLEIGVASAVPEPSTWAMMILGFAGLGFMAYRRRQTAALAA
jgi:hypothetical protein